jgi:hypothetical protein
MISHTAIPYARPAAVSGVAAHEAERVCSHTLAATFWSVRSLVRRDARCKPRSGHPQAIDRRVNAPDRSRHVLLILIAAAWTAVVTLSVAMCRAAARGDRSSAACQRGQQLRGCPRTAGARTPISSAASFVRVSPFSSLDGRARLTARRPRRARRFPPYLQARSRGRGDLSSGSPRPPRTSPSPRLGQARFSRGLGSARGSSCPACRTAARR